MSDLNPKQRRFIAEYLKDQNGTQAAIRAGYARRSAKEQACDLLTKPNIRSAVDKALAEISRKAEVTRERILQSLLNIAEFDPRKLYNPDGTIKLMSQLPDEIALVIASVESDNLAGDIKKFRFWDKVKALELLGKHLKLFDEGIAANAAPLVINIVPASNHPSGDTGH